MKRIITFILAAALLCPALVARADGAPTSECVSGLTARYSAGEDGYGSLNVEADVTGVSPDEYVAVTVYSDVVDVTDPPGETNRDPLTFRTFRASGVIADGKLAITLNYLTEKLTGVCVLCVQIPNRGENNDWVRVCVEAKLTADPDFEGGEPKTVWAPAGADAAEWLAANGNGLFERENMVISGWEGAEGAIPMSGMTVTAKWERVGGYLLGDMDFDGVHTVADALAVLRIASRLVVPGEIETRVGDVDFDDAVTVADALAVLRVAARLREPFDVYV